MEKDNLVLDNFLVMDSNIEKHLANRNIEFPFKNTLSFHGLIEHINTVASGEDKIKSSFARSILDEFEKAPELHGVITDLSLTKKYEKLIDNMMMFIFPSAFWDKQTYAAAVPFMSDIFYASPKFKEIIKITNGNIEGELNIDAASYNFGKAISGFAVILAEFYGVDLKFDFPLVYKINDPETGLDRYFKMNVAVEFIDVIAKGELKPLTKEELENIKANIYNLDYVKKLIPPENFEYRGFVVLNVINITDTEILSSIKKDLIEKDTITSFEGFLKLQHKLKSLLRSPDLLLGLADYPGTKEKLCHFGRKIGNSFLMSKNCLERVCSIHGSIYDLAFESNKAIIIDDLTKYKNKTAIEDEIIKQGVKNILVAPLLLDDKIVGVLELGSPDPGQINMVNSLKLREVLPLFAMAVERSREELNNKIRNIIKEKCTAIHPTLEWKFQIAALNLLQKEDEGIKAEMEEILFHDVFPLYGLSDIRNSSLQRNDAIREDLIENLQLAKSVLKIAKQHKELKIFDELIFKTEKKINSLNFGIDSGDESEVISFLNKKIVPLFEHIKVYDKEVNIEIEKYNSSLDNKLGFIYRRRKKFEESTMMVNNMIANYLDEEQVKIQKMFPHYFERYKTDGVDHGIYIGQSLVENKKFNKIYLKNLRLWQLLLMCGIVGKANELKKNLNYPLDTAHLILVQDSPLSIRFRYDEKKFDVDGAYNIRYEIMKKRIDKAEIKGKEERLTQPEKIAIVFSQNSEMYEYIEYIEYLQKNKYLKRELEELEIEELHGVKGLRALRVTVDLGNPNLGDQVNNEEIKKVIGKLSAN
ncbi:MAG: GAF domain-containing protein [Bacteroidota bacterium]|nr:GAF domain-containing protein [Bacteroidota bacterium]